MMVKVYYQCVYQYSEDTDKNPDFIKWMRHAMEDTDAVWSFTDEAGTPIVLDENRCPVIQNQKM